MHELGITRNVIAICAERANGAQVLRVMLEIGKRASVITESVRFCFDIFTKETLVEGATLEIVEPAGEELKIKEMGVA